MRWCEAHQRGLVDQIPPPKAAPVRLAVHHHAVLIRRGGKVLLEQRPADGLWAGMWLAPTIEAKRALRRGEVEKALPVPVIDLRKVERFEHNTTHRRITFHVFVAKSRARRGTWRRLDDGADLPMSNAQRRVLALSESP